MLQKDLLKIGKAIVIEGTKAVAFGAGISIVSQTVNLATNENVKTMKDLVSGLDISLDKIIKK